MLKKKSLGQHFLKNAHYAALIADTAEIKKGEHVLEVGPGDGALTRELLARGAHVTAVEKDRRLIPLLQEKFAQEIAAKKFEVIEADALEFDIEKWLDISSHSKKTPYKLVANIPYYITGALLRKFLTAERQPSRMVLLVQKEVAERIARDPKESILSLSVKAYGEPKYVKTVPRGAFAPAPNVNSAILAIRDISRKHFASQAQEKIFFELVRTGFAQKRKLLGRNLENVLGKNYSAILEHVSIPKNARAEDVPLEAWFALAANK